MENVDQSEASRHFETARNLDTVEMATGEKDLDNGDYTTVALMIDTNSFCRLTSVHRMNAIPEDETYVSSAVIKGEKKNYIAISGVIFFLLLLSLVITIICAGLGGVFVEGTAVGSPPPSAPRLGCKVYSVEGNGLLTAAMEVYPRYSGTLRPFGNVAIEFVDEFRLFVSVHMRGLNSSCVNCGIYVTTRTSCENPGKMGDYYFKDLRENLWNVANGAKYEAVNGKSKSEFVLPTELSYDNYIGHAVILEDKGTKISCGILEKWTDPGYRRQRLESDLYARIGKYPGYKGPLNPKGDINLKFCEKGGFNFHLRGVNGLESSCMQCGSHIHSGRTCTIVNEVGGHYWNDTKIADDVWTVDNGAFYNAVEGTSQSDFTLDSGFDYYDNIGHSVIIHSSHGERIGCGILHSGRFKNR